MWKRLSFTQKVTVRNIFRYKQRMIMTIFGVAGSVALLFCGSGNSIICRWSTPTPVWGNPQYDMILSIKSSLTDEEEQS